MSAHGKRDATVNEPERTPRLLVAEDNEVNRRVMHAMLGRLGFQPEIVENGRLAVESAAREPVDIILMDVQMPEMDGLAATRALRERSRNPPPWIIAVTANAMREDRERCLDAGMDDYLAKPVTMEQLSDALRRATTALGFPEPKRPTSTQPVLDETVLSSLRAAVGEEHVQALMQTFVTSAIAGVQSLREAVAARSLEDVEAHAHRLKGSSAVVGARALTEACSIVVEAARDGSIDLAGAERVYAELDRTLAVVDH